MHIHRPATDVSEKLRELSAANGALSKGEHIEVAELQEAASGIAQVGRCDRFSPDYVFARIDELHAKLHRTVQL